MSLGTLDHIAYAVRDTNESIANFRALYPVVVQFRCYVKSQDSYITFLHTPDGLGPKIEIVEPASPGSRVWGLVRENPCTIYHICYRVTDFYESFKRLRRLGWIALNRPFAVPDTSSELASHLYHRSVGMIEIIGRNHVS